MLQVRRALVDLCRLLQERLGACVVAALSTKAGEVVKALRRLRVARPERSLADLERTL